MGGKGGARRARLTSPQQTVGALHAPSTSCARWSRSCAAPDRRAAASEAAAGDCGSVRSPCADASPAARAASRAWCTRQGRSSRRPPLACEGRTPLRVVPGRCQLRDISRVSYEAQTDSASAAVPLASGAARSARRLRASRRARGGAAARGCVQLHTSMSHALALREHGPPLARELPAGNTRRAGRPSVASDGLWSAARARMTAGSAPPGLRWSPPRTPDANSLSDIHLRRSNRPRSGCLQCALRQCALQAPLEASTEARTGSVDHCSGASSAHASAHFCVKHCSATSSDRCSGTCQGHHSSGTRKRPCSACASRAAL